MRALVALQVNVVVDVLRMCQYLCLEIEALDTKGKMSWYLPVLFHRIK